MRRDWAGEGPVRLLREWMREETIKQSIFQVGEYKEGQILGKIRMRS